MFNFKNRGARPSEGAGESASTHQFEFSPHQIALLQLGFAGVVVLVALNLAGPVAQRMAALPIFGVVNAPTLAAVSVDNPMALPAAIAGPANRDEVQEVDLSKLDEIFLPPPVSEPVKVDSGAKSAEMVKAALAAVRVSAVATGGAFVNGLFISSGSPLGMNIPVENGPPVPVKVFVAGNRVSLKAGEQSRDVVFQ